MDQLSVSVRIFRNYSFPKLVRSCGNIIFLIQRKLRPIKKEGRSHKKKEKMLVDRNIISNFASTFSRVSKNIY